MNKNSYIYTSLENAKRKLEHFCSYQERCHSEVTRKLRSLCIAQNQIDEVIVHLIQHNFLNEERFSTSFARGKHRMNYWGKNRIVAELKFRNISEYNIKKALEELDDEMYYSTFDKISLAKWNSTNDKNILSKKKKVMSFLYRKGYDSDLIYSKIEDLSKQ